MYPSSKRLALLKFGTALALLLLLAAHTGAVLGHSTVVGSEPADGAALERSPGKVAVWFSEELDPSGSLLEVLNEEGQAVDLGDGKVDLNDLEHRRLIVSVPPDLPQGTYTIHWITASTEDGDSAEGLLSFGIGETPAGPITIASEPSSDSGISLPFVAAAGLLILAALLIMVAVRRRGANHDLITKVSEER